MTDGRTLEVRQVFRQPPWQLVGFAYAAIAVHGDNESNAGGWHKRSKKRKPPW
jgi:hypothetical protein